MAARRDGPPAAPLDRLHRALYLRREFALVAACGAFDGVRLAPPPDRSADGPRGALWRGRIAIAPSPAPTPTAAVASAPTPTPTPAQAPTAAVTPPPAQAPAQAPAPTPTAAVASAPTPTPAQAPAPAPSPWAGAAFGFVVRVPPRYPFECPAVRLESPLESHPLLRKDSEGRRCVVPFEEVYLGLDPMRVSVMAQVLHCVRSMFYPAEWKTDEPVDESLARLEVEQGSMAQEVILEKPYVDLLSKKAVAFFTDLKGVPASDASADVLESDREWESKFSLWFGRTWLPAVRLLQ